MIHFLVFIVGFFIGSWVEIFLLAAINTGKRADEKEQEYWEKTK